MTRRFKLPCPTTEGREQDIARSRAIKPRPLQPSPWETTPEYVGLVLGLRKVWRISVREPHKRDLVDFCKRKGLLIECSDYKLPKDPTASLGGDTYEEVLFWISRDKRSLLECKDLDDRCFSEKPAGKKAENVHARLGEFLGYPPCCIESFLEGNARIEVSGPRSTYSYHIFRSHSASRAHSFLLNNLIVKNNLWLISHQPCAYDCKESMRGAGEILRHCENTHRAFFGRLVGALKRPVLYFEDQSRILVDGHVEKNGAVRYRRLFPLGETSREMLQRHREMVGQGNTLAREKEAVMVLKDDRPLGILHARPGEDSDFPLTFDFR